MDKKVTLEESEHLWDSVGKRLDWVTPYTQIKDVSYALDDFKIRWYGDGTLNACYNCIDRHLPHKEKDTAIIWEPNNPQESAVHISYKVLYKNVCKLANALKKMGISKGDRVILYMPMIPELSYAMLACARIGAIHSVVFGGFSARAIADRLEDSGAQLIITADFAKRGAKHIPLKEVVDRALDLLLHKSAVEHVVVVQNTGTQVMMRGNDRWYHEVLADTSHECPPAEMAAEDALFILYTSGSTGKPKGVLHTTGGYLAYASYTHELVFEYQSGEVYWCTADIGWITGHSYLVYGPLANGAVTLMYEGVPTYPTPARLWEIVDRHQVNIFYTAPTAIRALAQEGDQYLANTSRKSLRVIGSVGEPLNPEAWKWYYYKVGNAACPIVDTWWQTETGGVLMSPLPSDNSTLKPGSVHRPLPGIKTALLGADGTEVSGSGTGALAIKDSWPGQMRGVYRNNTQFMQTYFTACPGYYMTGDGAKRDQDGDYWITGRTDDVINVSGHRIGSAEVEYVLNNHPKIAESAVVGFPHPVKGQGIHAFISLMSGESLDDEKTVNAEVIYLLRKEIGPLVRADKITVVAGLPKTRSGKIMRRILKKISSGAHSELGDITTLADPSVVDAIVACLEQ